MVIQDDINKEKSFAVSQIFGKTCEIKQFPAIVLAYLFVFFKNILMLVENTN
jgi:hypothetical protein